MADKKYMRDLYQRLKAAGFDRAFIGNCVLPEWWQDEMAEVPANRAYAETALARQLGFPIHDLRDPQAVLSLDLERDFRLKRRKGTTLVKLLPALVLGRRLARLIAGLCHNLPRFHGLIDALDARKAILDQHCYVDLPSLLEFCWSQGIIVGHLHPRNLPKASRIFAGMALYAGERPVILLASKSDSPPWLAFHLAHELGHVLKGHVAPTMQALVDVQLEPGQEDPAETAADKFAMQLLTGETSLKFSPQPGLTARRLASAATDWGRKHNVAPGSVALIYGRTADRWGPAQMALKHLKQTEGGQEAIRHELLRHIEIEDAPESTVRLVSCLSLAA